LAALAIFLMAWDGQQPDPAGTPVEAGR